MANRRWARIGSVTLAIVLWLCLGLAMPIVLSLYSSDVATDAVEASPADAFALAQPILLSAAPGVQLERGTVAFVDSNGQSQIAPANGAPPSQNIRLFNSTITLGASLDAGSGGARASPSASSPTATNSFPLSPHADALLSGKYETLSLRRATLVLNGFFEAPETLTDVKAEVSLRRRGFISIKGTGLLRGERVTLDATANVGQAERRGTALHRLPVKMSLKGDLLDFNFDGRMVLGSAADDIELQGQGDLSLQNGRGLARWFGALWPRGPGLRDISVRGQVHLGKQMLAFENAVVRMDGNEGAGVLGLRLRQPRPMLSATLAYKSFDARPYLASPSIASTVRDASEGLSWSSIAAGALTVPLGLHLDADMRISADRVQLGVFEFGRAAATIALKDGRLLADLTDLKFIGGEGGGQITADFSSFAPKVTVRGKLEQVDLGLLTGSLPGGQLAQGKAGIVADIAGSGATLQDVLQGLAGKIAIRAQSPGRLAVDLRTLSQAAREREIVGWGAATRGATAYETLDLRLVLRDGTILTESAEARTIDGLWTAVGVVNLLSDRMDMRLIQSAQGGAPHTAPLSVIELHGPLREPRLKASTAP